MEFLPLRVIQRFDERERLRGTGAKSERALYFIFTPRTERSEFYRFAPEEAEISASNDGGV
jgi:hypothetical protein